MDFGFSPEEERFRQEVRSFFLANEKLVHEARLEYEATAGLGKSSYRLYKMLGDHGWLCPHWPKKYGGLDLPGIYRFITMNEVSYFTDRQNQVGTGVAGPVILRFGTEEQKDKYLPPIGRGDVEYAIGYTEPQAGSDTSAIALRAVEKEDHFLLNGQKMFNGAAHYAQFHWLMARTEVTDPRHRGLSLFVVDLKTPGITVRPLYVMGGGKGTSVRVNEVFYEDVKVPKDCLIGKKNRGFYMLMEALAFERVQVTGNQQREFEEVVKCVKELGKDNDPLIRQEIAQVRTSLELLRLLSIKIIWMMESKIVPDVEPAMSKILRGDLTERLGKLHVRLHGHFGLLNKDSKWAVDEGLPEYQYRNYPRDHITAGTPEIMRDIIAYRGLGLPRGR